MDVKQAERGYKNLKGGEWYIPLGLSIVAHLLLFFWLEKRVVNLNTGNHKESLVRVTIERQTTASAQKNTSTRSQSEPVLPEDAENVSSISANSASDLARDDTAIGPGEPASSTPKNAEKKDKRIEPVQNANRPLDSKEKPVIESEFHAYDYLIGDKKLEYLRDDRNSRSLNDTDNTTIFDPQLKEKIAASRSARASTPAQRDLVTYTANSGDEYLVVGDKCIRTASASANEEVLWGLPSRCPWEKTESEKMLDGINRALNERR